MSKEELLKLRTAAKGWVTREAGKLRELSKAVVLPTIIELGVAISQFEQRLRKLDDIQERLEPLLDEKELEDEMNVAAEYRDTQIDILIAAKQLQSDLNEQTTGRTSSQFQDESRVSANEASNKPSIGFPKLELTHFALFEKVILC